MGAPAGFRKTGAWQPWQRSGTARRAAQSAMRWGLALHPLTVTDWAVLKPHFKSAENVTVTQRNVVLKVCPGTF